MASHGHISKPEIDYDWAERLCLTCQEMFKSEWVGNRRCKRCQELVSYGKRASDESRR